MTPKYQWVGDASLTYVPTRFLGGSHELKLGYQASLRDITGNSSLMPQGNYALMFDVTNSNAITAVTYVSGPSFGRVSDIVPPRTLRVAATLDF